MRIKCAVTGKSVIWKTSFLNWMKCAFIHFGLLILNRTRVTDLSLTQIESWVINASIVFSREKERQRDVNVSEMKPSDRMFMRCQFVFGSEELTGAERETLGLYGAQLRDPFALLGSVPLGSVALWWGALDAVPMLGSGSCSLTWQSMSQLSGTQTRVSTAGHVCSVKQRWIPDAHSRTVFQSGSR